MDIYEQLMKIENLLEESKNDRTRPLFSEGGSTYGGLFPVIPFEAPVGIKCTPTKVTDSDNDGIVDIRPGMGLEINYIMVWINYQCA